MSRLQVVSRFGKESKRIAAVAAYEDSQTDARVTEFCRNLGRHLGEQCEISRQMWLFNELRIPQLRTIAAGEAAEADLVIISIHHAPSLPSEVREWMELWVGQKRRRPVVLLALFDPVFSGDSSSMLNYLKEASKKGKIEFLTQSEELTAPD